MLKKPPAPKKDQNSYKKEERAKIKEEGLTPVIANLDETTLKQLRKITNYLGLPKPHKTKKTLAKTDSEAISKLITCAYLKNIYKPKTSVSKNIRRLFNIIDSHTSNGLSNEEVVEKMENAKIDRLKTLGRITGKHEDQWQEEHIDLLSNPIIVLEKMTENDS